METSNAAASPIRVVVAGPHGRMGRVMMDGLPRQDGLTVTAGLARGDDAAKLFADADVLVEFTHVNSSPDLLHQAIEAGVRPVSGTSGLSEDVLASVDDAARKRGIGAIWAPHFHLGGVLLIHFARIAARYFDSAEIIEAHHATKADAPSGAATEIARIIRAEHGSDMSDPPVRNVKVPDVRGGVHGGVRIHSIRQPGILGSHDLIFAGGHETLTIRHADNSREGFVPTVTTAVRKVMQPDVVGLVRGYDSVIGLSA